MQENDSSKKKIKDMSNIPLIAYLALSTIMFFAGVYGFLSRRNMLTILMSLELMLNAADINFAAFNRYLFPDQLQGHFFALFVVGIAAAEAAVAIALVINIYRRLTSIDVDKVNEMKY